jgi:hypothetical protein
MSRRGRRTDTSHPDRREQLETQHLRLDIPVTTKESER